MGKREGNEGRGRSNLKAGEGGEEETNDGNEGNKMEKENEDRKTAKGRIMGKDEESKMHG